MMPKLRKTAMQKVIKFNELYNYLTKMFNNDVHAKRVLSITNAVLGIITSASLAIHFIGQGLAIAKGTVTKHAIKQVDRLLSNMNFNVWEYFYTWVLQVVGSRKVIIVAMDWTEFDDDGHSTIALYLITNHGRATPLIWKTHAKSKMKDNRNIYEKNILQHLKDTLPKDVHVTILADRGFGYVEFYDVLEELSFDYVVRFKNNIYVTNNAGETRLARDWVGKGGRATRLANAGITKEFEKRIAVVICVWEKDMKEPWCLVASNDAFKTRELINFYAKRWTIEPKFRDQKNLRFGMGMYNISIAKEERRDRLFFLGAIADLLLTILGAAGEALGLDRLLKANTVKRRVHSLYKQGLMWYELIPNMPEERFRMLMEKFSELLLQQPYTKEILSFV